MTMLDWIILIVSMILLMAFSVKTFGTARGVADRQRPVRLPQGAGGEGNG